MVWPGSMGFLGARSQCLSALLGWRWQMLVLQEVQLTAVLGAALLREASVSPFGSSFSYYVLLRDRRR